MQMYFLHHFLRHLNDMNNATWQSYDTESKDSNTVCRMYVILPTTNDECFYFVLNVFFIFHVFNILNFFSSTFLHLVLSA